MFGRALDRVADRFGGFGSSKMGNMIEVRVLAMQRG